MTKSFLYRSFLGLVLFVSCQVFAADTVMVKGLFNNAALLIIDGQQVMLKKGKTKSGVTLIDANSREAVLEINGQRQRVGLSKQVGGSYQKVNKRVVRIASQEGGHHIAAGEINGRKVEFVVDTGATLIALNNSTAKRLGIDINSGKKGYTNTANGIKEVRLMNLHKVTLGSITHYNVPASVSLDDSLPVILLGNSFLSRNNMRIENGVLILESK